MIQWHPIFAQLLRPAVEAYYEVETTFPVGDAPREADFVLLRRMTGPPPPFRGLWRNLTPWNVLELHIVGQEPLATERAVAQLVVEQPKLQQLYGGWMASLHPSAWQEIEAMVRKTGKSVIFDMEPAIEALGLDRIIETVGTKRVVDLIGAKRFLEEIGPKRFLKEVGSKRFLEEIDLVDLLANLSPAKRRELKRRLQ